MPRKSIGRLDVMMQFVNALSYVQRTCSVWRILVGSLMVWIFVFVCTFIPSLPDLPSHGQGLPGTNANVTVLKQKLREVSKMSEQYIELINIIQMEIQDMIEIEAFVGHASLLIEKSRLHLAEMRAQKGDLPSTKHEQLTRKLEHSISEIWDIITLILNELESNETQTPQKAIKTALELISEEQVSLLRDVHELKAASGSEGWREREVKELGEIVQRQLYHLQNPRDCHNARMLVVKLPLGCGFGCQAHNLVYNFILAIGLNRTLVLAPSYWPYHKYGWEAAYLPISRDCPYFIGKENDNVFDAKKKAVRLFVTEHSEEIRSLPFMPCAIPEYLAPRLLRVHGQPFVWWVGQLLKYLMQPQPHLQEDIAVTEKLFGFKRPIVGVHIRRSDKIGREANYHDVEEYMSHVEHYYKQQRPHSKKRIYLATDCKKAHGEIARRYPEYEIIGDKNFATLANVESRYTGPSLRSIIIDIHFLSMTDYLVCTFSSQVCRLAYELMQTQHPDASNWFRSLDDIYYFGEQNAHLQEVVFDHLPKADEEIELKKGDMIWIVGNHWNGYSMGKNQRTGQKGIYPSYKVKDHVVISEFVIDDINRRLALSRSRIVF